jgi:plasmid maintenance system antidote protein VapI
MRHSQIRLAILQKFGTQTDFAAALGTSESQVSKVVRGRRELSSNEARQWSKLLKCNMDLLEPVINKNQKTPDFSETYIY